MIGLPAALGLGVGATLTMELFSYFSAREMMFMGIPRTDRYFAGFMGFMKRRAFLLIMMILAYANYFRAGRILNWELAALVAAFVVYSVVTFVTIRREGP